MFKGHPNAILHRTTHHNPRKRIYFENPKLQYEFEKDYWNNNLFLKKSRKMVKQKRRRNRKRRSQRKRRIPRSLMPPSKVIRLKFSDYQSHNNSATANLYANYVNGTSVIDPLLSASSQQPLGYDQWKALYKEAYVIGCKVKITCHNTATSSLIYGITPMQESQGTTALTDYEHYRELPGTVSRLLSPEMDHSILISKRSTKKMLHLKNIKDNDEVKHDLVTETAPSRNYYFHVWTQPTNKTTALSSNPELIYDIEYIILLTNPVVPGRSQHT